MDPSQLVPTPDILPAPWGFFSVLSILTFTLHIILANMLLGGGMIALWNHLRNNSNLKEEIIGTEASRGLPVTMAFTINLGVPPLLFLQVMYGQFIYVSSVLMALSWLSIFVLLILAYYGTYLYRYKFEQLGRARTLVLGVSVLLLLVVGFFFTNSLLLMIDPVKWVSYFEEAGGRVLHLSEPTLIPRYLHFFLSSIAIGGLTIGIVGWFRVRQGDPRWEAWSGDGLLIFGCATLLQFIVGAWYLGALPKGVLSALFLEGGAVFPVFLVAIMAGGASTLFAFTKMPWHTAGCAFLTILLMVIFRNAVRGAYLAPYLALHKTKMVPQLGPAILFVCALLGGIIVIGAMFRLVAGSGKESQR